MFNSIFEVVTSAEFLTGVGSLGAVVAAYVAYATWRDQKHAALKKEEDEKLNLSTKEKIQQLLDDTRKAYELVRWDAERKFEETVGHRISDEAIVLQPELSNEYLPIVERGVTGIEKMLKDPTLSPERQSMQDLIEQLKITHRTLLKTLDIFLQSNAEKFFKDFSAARDNFTSMYLDGRIASDAHTHCSKVIELANYLATRAPDDVKNDLHGLVYNVENLDRDMILPLMRSIMFNADIRCGPGLGAEHAIEQRGQVEIGVLNREALITGSPRIEVECSLTAFVKRVAAQNSSPRGVEIRRFKDQLTRFAANLRGGID